MYSTVASTNNTTTVTANSVTTTANDDLVLAFFGSVSNSTYTPPGGWTERGDVGVTGISGSTADEIKTTAGATGNVSATSTVSARVYGHQAAFKVDNVAPSVTMSDPGSPVTGTITLQTSAASDTDSYVSQVQFQRSPAGAGSWTNVGSPDTTSPYSVSFDTSTVSDGLYDFRAVATDGAGNTGNSATISNRRIDNNAPSSTTTFPASGGSYNTSGWNAGCGTNGFCGTYSDAANGSGVQKVEISIRRNTGNYWNGSSFGSGSEVWNTTSLSGGNWSYTFPASSFPADDTYTIRVRATDNVNIAETPNSRSFTYDTAAPDTSITANPADPTTSTSASFSFTSTEGSSTFECQLDGGGYSSCTSPKSYSSLSDGSHTFLVRATDPAGNTDASAASHTWQVDTTAPSSTITFPGSGSSYNTSGWNAGCATNGICGTYSDATSGVQKVEISIRQGAGNYWSAGSFSSGSEVWNTTSLSGGNWSYTFPASSFPADGSYTIRVKATDNVGERRDAVEPLVHDRPRRAGHVDHVQPVQPLQLDERELLVQLDRGRLHVRVPDRRRGLLLLLEPEELFLALRGEPHRHRAGDRRGREHGRHAGELHMDGRLGRAELDDDLPRLRGCLQHFGLECGLRHDRLLRRLLGRDLGRLHRRDLDPPGDGQLLERQLLRKRERGLEHDLAVRRELVVRIRGRELPGRRRLHDPRARDRRRRQRRDTLEPQLHLRRDEPERALHLPGLGRELRQRSVERGLRHERLLRHVLRRDLGRAERRDLDPPGRRQLLERLHVRERQRGLPDGIRLRRQLVVHVLGRELPRRRLLHRPRSGDGQRVEHGVGPEPELHDRQREPERALHLPGVGWELLELGLERGLRHERLLRHVLGFGLGCPVGRDLDPPGRRQLLERLHVRERQRGLPDGIRRRRQLVVRLLGRRASPPTGATPSTSGRRTSR